MEEEEGSSDKNTITKDGSVDHHGKPALKETSGGWRCGILLLVNQGLVILGFAGIEVNLVLFSKSVLRYSHAEAAHTFSTWMGTVYLFSLMGAFLSDSYLGRYLTCVVFQVIYIIGLIALSLSTHLFLLTPQGCGKIGEQCEAHKPFQIALFYTSINLIALGNGAPEAALAAFGADQFDEEDPKERHSKASFYTYFYLALNLGALAAETILVYVEDMGHWVVAFWTCTLSAIVAYAFLLSGNLRYRHFKPCGNPISRFSQVIVASLRKFNQKLPLNGEELYEVHLKESERNGMRKILHSNGFKFLDRAAIIVTEDMKLISTTTEGQSTQNPWHVCTVTQVEEVKCVLRLLPIWLCTIFSSVVFVQMLSLFIEQGAVMNRRVFNFDIPPASMTVFDFIFTSLFIMLYDRLIFPLHVKLTKRAPKHLSALQRIGIGLAIASLAMLVAGVIEQRRRKFAIDSLKQETSSLSIMWQIPQYVLVGASDAFVYVARMEFFASQTPDGLKSLGIGLSLSASAMGSYVASAILTVVMKITSSDGKPGWVPPNLNDGHLDWFYFLSAALAALNFGLYVVCAKHYKPISFEKRDGATEMEVLDST
ncbi:protein NRT1/ PTR FAMILY 7.3-like [Humulus lupulus]|uniref:protein NRT1/ PTR FAMILY 7.3-like n=1 Tax=Humulus lupulus TaxID=3486 RepID=UPI002B4012C7|nr:protein NRT1/ PTR FAMILY 7.3-like [Humulus lupulus]